MENILSDTQRQNPFLLMVTPYLDKNMAKLFLRILVEVV